MLLLPIFGQVPDVHLVGAARVVPRLTPKLARRTIKGFLVAVHPWLYLRTVRHLHLGLPPARAPLPGQPHILMSFSELALGFNEWSGQQ
jgi:hypothetical protein